MSATDDGTKRNERIRISISKVLPPEVVPKQVQGRHMSSIVTVILGAYGFGVDRAGRLTT